MIHIYARVSTDKQENGREAQVDRLMQWVGGQHHRLHVDEDVSAFSVPLNRRPAGKVMCDLLQTGDTVLMTKIDRGFRSWADAANTHAKWRALGVSVRFIDLDIDLSTPQGELFFSQMVAFGQYESRMHGQRKREVYAHKKQSGQPYSTIRPYGWKVVKKLDKVAGRLRPVGWEEFPEERALAEKVKAMRAADMSWSLIADELICDGVRKPKGGRGEYYYGSDLKALVLASEAGYPKIPQGAWQDRVRARTQPAG